MSISSIPPEDCPLINTKTTLFKRINLLATKLNLSYNELEWMYEDEALVNEIESSLIKYSVNDEFRASDILHFNLHSMAMCNYGCNT